jgi:hypothetical protein
MTSITKALLAAAATLTLTAGAASAAIVCNDEGECWHVHGQPSYGPHLKLSIHPDNWKWGGHEKYKWREHAGHGYWRGGSWIEIK